MKGTEQGDRASKLRFRSTSEYGALCQVPSGACGGGRASSRRRHGEGEEEQRESDQRSRLEGRDNRSRRDDGNPGFCIPVRIDSVAYDRRTIRRERSSKGEGLAGQVETQRGQHFTEFPHSIRRVPDKG